MNISKEQIEQWASLCESENEETEKIPFELNFSKILDINISDVLREDEITNEGIDVTKRDDGERGGKVTYNRSHNDGVDSSIENNPTLSNIDINDKTIKVYSIAQRVKLENSLIGSDGNPMLYAFKNEKGYVFNSKEDELEITKDIKSILRKFLEEYYKDIREKVVTIVLPSGNTLNGKFMEWFREVAEELKKTVKVYDEVLEKISTDVVREVVLDDSRSEFNQWISNEKNGLRIKERLMQNLKTMDEQHGGTFSYHYVSDPKTRNMLSLSMKLTDDAVFSKMFEDINGCDILLLDDSVSRGTSLKEAYSLLVKHYQPKSVTGLVLFSPLR